MKKRVLIIRSTAISYDSRTQKTAQWLKDDYDVELLGWNREGIEEISKKDFGTIYRIGPKADFGGGFKNLFKLLHWQFSILNFIVKNRKKYDVLHCADLDTVLFPFLLRPFLKYDIVYDIYDYFTACRNFPKPISFVLAQLENFVIKNVNGLILVDENRIEQIHTTLPDKTEIIYNTPIIMDNIDDSQVVTSLIISYVGVLDNIRFLRQLIDIISQKPDWILHIGGYGPIEDEIKTAASKQSNIHFYGRVSPEEAMSINAKSAVLLAIYDPAIPNHRFSSPNKFFESLYLGKILIVANNTSVDTKVRDFHAGYTFDYNNIDDFIDLLDAIKQLDYKEIKHISDNNRKIYAEYYSPDKMKQKLLSLYSSLT